MNLPKSEAILQYHDHCLTQSDWPPQEGTNDGDYVFSDIVVWISENHRQNSLLWAQEDLARRTKVSDSEIAANKRAIDKCNQARNDAIERMDEILLTTLGLLTPQSRNTTTPIFKPSSSARLNSETAGSMIDRMSILSLKIRAMHQQSLREDASFELRAECRAKHDRLKTQRQDLASCFDELLFDTSTGVAWFQVYRQFKMYNDPRLNPALLAEKVAQTLEN